FEKEKQHDIRNFFSPKPDGEKKRKRTENEETSELVEIGETVQSPDVVQEVGTGDCKLSLDKSEVVDVDALFQDDDFEQQSKRLKTKEITTPKSSSVKKRKSWSGKPCTLFSSPRSRGLSENTALTPERAPLVKKQWDCTACTYTNDPLLPYCEMCESPRDPNVPEKKKQSVSSGCSQDGKENQRQSDVDNEIFDCTQQDAAPSPAGDLQRDHLINIENNNVEAHPGDKSASEPEQPENSVCFPAYDGLMFCASRNTDRIYLYNKDGEPMNCNFIPLDIKLENWEDLPEEFQEKPNRSL
ncbi:DNA annealing helicase and endonuclease ZRANB3-like, partial [Discoglossus pictus]